MLVKNTLLYGLARALPGLLTFAALAVYSRVLEPADYGVYSLVFYSVAFAEAVLCNWVGVSLVRFMQGEGSYEALLSNVRFLILAITVVMALTGGFIAWQLELAHPAWALTLVVGALLITEPWYNLNLKLAIAEIAPIRYGKIAFIRALGALTFGAGLAALGFGAVGALAGLAIGGLLSAAWPSVATRWLSKGTQIMDAETVRAIAAYGIPLSLTYALTFVIGYSDRYILAYLKDTETVGLYASGYDLASLGMAVQMTINMAAYPLAVRALERGSIAAAQRQMLSNLCLFLIVTIPILIMLTIYAPQLTSVVIGPQFRSAATQILPIVGPAVLLGGLRSYYLDMSFHLAQRTWPIMIITGIAALSNLLFNFLWIPAHGILGAAWATLVAYALAFAVSLVLGLRLGIRLPRPDRQVAMISLAGVASALVCTLIRLPSLSGFVLGAGTLIVSFGGFMLLFHVDIARRGMQLAFSKLTAGVR